MEKLQNETGKTAIFKDAEPSSVLPNQPQAVTLYKVEQEKKVICDVCGYANPEYTAICKKCSNYL